ncbi:hypothetical protein ABIB81_009183, partial [Bradyrhizobium sp. I1.7.5]
MANDPVAARVHGTRPASSSPKIFLLNSSFVKNWRRRPAQAVFRAGTVSKKARMMTRKS